MPARRTRSHPTPRRRRYEGQSHFDISPVVQSSRCPRAKYQSARLRCTSRRNTLYKTRRKARLSSPTAPPETINRASTRSVPGSTRSSARLPPKPAPARLEIPRKSNGASLFQHGRSAKIQADSNLETVLIFPAISGWCQKAIWSCKRWPWIVAGMKHGWPKAVGSRTPSAAARP